MEIRMQQHDALFVADKLAEFESECNIMAKAYRQFADGKLDEHLPADDKAQAKESLNQKLETLNSKLDTYLAGNYGISPEKKKEYAQWPSSHMLFHWFAEFYHIIASRGSFDVIIGDPSYVQYSSVKDVYTIHGYRTIESNDLYALIIEQSNRISADNGKTGFIVPMSYFSVSTFRSTQQLILENSNHLYVSNWSGDAHPSKLFEGVDKRLHILLSSRGQGKCEVFSSDYIKWYAIERRNIFGNRVNYVQVKSDSDYMLENSLPKISNPQSMALAKKLATGKKLALFAKNGKAADTVFYTRKVSFFLQFLDFIPKIFDENNVQREPSELKRILFESSNDRDVALAGLSSSLFYWFYIVNSDCRNLNKREVYSSYLPILDSIGPLTKDLMDSYEENSSFRTVTYKSKGAVTVQYFSFRPSKPILYEIDTVLAQHYGFSIINYDIKYRMGGAVEDDDE